MIRFTLKCSKGHRFDSWFADSEAYETLATRRALSCAVCGIASVEKAPMAPAVSSRDEAEAAPLTKPASAAEQALAALRRKIEAEADYVGDRFASEARAMHEGESDRRPIWGEAKPEDAKSLLEDGVPVLPLPFGPRKTN
ncbi:MAG: DUF1178 family protein [Rubricella sp.]